MYYSLMVLLELATSSPHCPGLDPKELDYNVYASAIHLFGSDADRHHVEK
jgi:hypothetical protein